MKFTLPDQLPATVAELDELANQAKAEINVYQARNQAGEEFSKEDVERLQYLVESHETLTGARDELAAAEQEQADNLNSLLDRAASTTAAPAAPAAPEAPAAPADDDAGEGSEAAADVVAEAEAATAEAADKQPVLVAAGGGGGGVANPAFVVAKNDIPANGPAGEAPKGWQLLPSAPKYAEFGTDKVSSRTIADAIDSIQIGQSGSGQPTGSGKLGTVTFAKQAIAKMDRPHGAVISDPQELFAELERIGNEIPGKGKVNAQALVAAGGWCAPSEQLYDFCPTAPAKGLLSLPEITIQRGGIRFPAEPDFSALQTGFHFTEAELQAVDGTTGDPTAVKDCVEIPCADDMVEYRLEAIGWCVKAGILQRQGWPELIQKFVDEFLVAHQQRVSALTLQKMVATAGAAKVIPTDSVLGATSGVLNGLHVQATNLQLKTRKATVEGVAPLWFREVLRADLALRDGLDVLSVSDAQIDNWLALRGIYLQYEGTWQSLGAGQPGHLDTVEWPATAQVLLYPAGTFFRSLDNVITLGVQYPMDQVRLNRYTHGFVEDSFLVGKRCDPSVLVTVPLCISGAVGARQQVGCNTPAPTP